MANTAQMSDLYDYMDPAEAAVTQGIMNSHQDQSAIEQEERAERTACDVSRIQLIKQQIFCRCGMVLDVRRAVILDLSNHGTVICVRCWTDSKATVLHAAVQKGWLDKLRIVGGSGAILYSPVRLPGDPVFVCEYSQPAPQAVVTDPVGQQVELF